MPDCMLGKVQSFFTLAVLFLCDTYSSLLSTLVAQLQQTKWHYNGMHSTLMVQLCLAKWYYYAILCNIYSMYYYAM